jgi:hypothetical protein
MLRKSLLSEWGLPLLLMIVVAITYFWKCYDGYRFNANDQKQQEYFFQPFRDALKETGENPLWAKNLFSGMPAYLVHYQPKGVFWKEPIYYMGNLLREYPPAILLIGLLGFFLLLRVEGLRGPLALGGAFAFIMMSYYTNMIVATHWGKSNVLFTAPYGLAGLSLLYQGRWAGGIVLSLLGWAGMVGGHHPQMLYYVLSLWVGYGLYRFWEAWRQKTWRVFTIATLLTLFSAGVGALSQASNLLPYYEYGQYSIRGGSELERDWEQDIARQTGLDKAYAQAYSASRAEVWTLIIPDFVGGTSQENLLERLGRSSALLQVFRENGIQDLRFLQAVPTYWGGSPFSAGSFYAGIIPFLLMILGLLYKADALDWILIYLGWLLLQLSLGLYGYSLWATGLLLLLPWVSYRLPRQVLKPVWRPWATTALFLAGWGLISYMDDNPENSYKLTDLALDYLPFYNKFRAPSTILVVMGFLWGWLGMRGLARFMEAPAYKKLWVALGLTVGILVVVGLGANQWEFAFTGYHDVQLQQQGARDWLLQALREDRIALAQRSAFRGILWVLLTGAVLVLFMRRWLGTVAAPFLVALLIISDGWLLNNQYFPQATIYVRKTQIQIPPPMKPYEAYLRQTDTSFYRVLPTHTATYTDAEPGAYLENVGGYHPAKLKRYQQLIQAHLERMDPKVLWMLGVKYLTAYPGSPVPSAAFDSIQAFPDGIHLYKLREPIRYAWLVESLAVYPRIDQTLDSLPRHDLTRVGVIYQGDLDKLPLKPVYSPLDSTETVKVIKRLPTKEILLRVRTKQPRLLLLSEVHYPPDWKATIDDQPTPVVYANFVLRSVAVPPGEHIVRIFLESSVDERGRQLSLVGSSLAWLLVGLFGLWTLWLWRKRRS